MQQYILSFARFKKIPSSLSFDDEKISQDLLMNSLSFSLRKHGKLPIQHIRTHQNDCVFTWNIMSAESAGISGTKCSRMDQVKFLEEKIFGLLRQTASLQVFSRLPSTNFAWPILEYFIPSVSTQEALRHGQTMQPKVLQYI